MVVTASDLLLEIWLYVPVILNAHLLLEMLKFWSPCRYLFIFLSLHMHICLYLFNSFRKFLSFYLEKEGRTASQILHANCTNEDWLTLIFKHVPDLLPKELILKQ